MHGLSSIFLNEVSDIVGLGIKFNSIGYRIKSSGKNIISEISGSAHDASLLGIMGPSGSGKSTLVNILSGKLHATAGSISLQGVETSLSDLGKFKDLIGYVPQDDVVHPHLTVRENILFSARIRLGGILKEREIHQNVDQLILALGLINVKDNLVGDQERRGVSGGERKRVSIGVELIAAPRMLILDEPTSGLDAQAALSIIMLLKLLSQYGITVICVLHQPRVEIFNCLDTLLLLVSGKQAYFGKRSKSKQYFSDMGYDFDPQLNPADVMLDIVSSPLPRFPKPAHNVINGTGPKCSEEISQNSSIPRKANCFTFEKLEALHSLHRTRISPWYRQVYLCFSRDIKQQSRNKGSFLLELFASVLTGILLGLAMYEFKGQLYQGMYLPPFQILSSAANYTLVPEMGVLCCLAISFASAAPSVSAFTIETQLLRREFHSGHSESAYFVAKVLSSLVRTSLSALHFTSYYMILATPTIAFRTFLGLALLYFYCIYGLGSIVATLTKRENGPLACLLLTIVIGIFGGYAPRLAKAKEWNLVWFWYLCPGTWFNEAFYTGHIQQYAYLYDQEAAELYTGYTTGRIGLDAGLLLLMGTVYRIIGCSLMVIQARKGSWSFSIKVEVDERMLVVS
ncbi:hypothetical protein VE03_07124 [Pseudogymnoascus sp. 23342-1-I1]|nr:hypothetical protein VE03_07124 [Pseudogymnoascus sp. 23342-1-I1]